MERNNIGQYVKGSVGTWKGKHLPLYYRLQISNKLKGRKLPLSTRIKMSKARKGKPQWWNKKGSKRDEEHKKKISLGLKKAYLEKRRIPINKGVHNPKAAGEKNNFWKGGVSKINRTERMNIMSTLEYVNWRRKVFERDDYTCLICFQRGGELHADHIMPFSLYPELRLSVDNGRTLCVNCHRKTDTWGIGNKFINKVYETKRRTKDEDIHIKQRNLVNFWLWATDS